MIIPIEIPRIYLTVLDALLIKTFETTNIPIPANKESIKILSENPKGIIVRIGKIIQCNKHKLALVTPKISYDLFMLLFI